jgi:glycosyltransferase involved in cell wall biosynthesis
MRLAVYTDYPYHEIDGRIFAERAFALFLSRLAPHFESFTVIGRLAPGTDRSRYALGEQVRFVSLPYYAKLSEPLPALKALAGSLQRYWHTLDDTDCVWLLGPHPFSFLFAALAKLRGKGVVLGVREDLPKYIRNRHPNRRLLHAAADALALAFRALGRTCPVIAVGPELARQYRQSRRLLPLTVSLVDAAEVVQPASSQRDYGGELSVLSVGRLDSEKNPLLLADILAQLNQNGEAWRLIVCGEGSMDDQLRARLGELGVQAQVDIRGYLPHHRLTEIYRQSHMLLHVSWTEGLPQVLFEAFAAALPVVATDVGGIAEATPGAVSLIPPGDANAAARELRRLRDDPALRSRQIEEGHALAERSTTQAECRRVVEFMCDHTDR